MHKSKIILLVLIQNRQKNLNTEIDHDDQLFVFHVKLNTSRNHLLKTHKINEYIIVKIVYLFTEEVRPQSKLIIPP